MQAVLVREGGALNLESVPDPEPRPSTGATCWSETRRGLRIASRCRSFPVRTARGFGGTPAKKS